MDSDREIEPCWASRIGPMRFSEAPSSGCALPVRPLAERQEGSQYSSRSRGMRLRGEGQRQDFARRRPRRRGGVRHRFPHAGVERMRERFEAHETLPRRYRQTLLEDLQ